MTLATRFGLPGRKAFPPPWLEKEKATKAIQDVMTKMDRNEISEKDAKKIINAADRVIEKDDNKVYKMWLDKYNNFTRRLEKLCKSYKMI